MRVLHIVSGDLWGGAEAQMGLQIRAQRELGLDSMVLLFNPGETAKRYDEFGIPLTIISERNGLLNLFTLALEHVRELKPQLVVSHGYKETFVASYIALLGRIPFISTIHGGTESYSGIKAFKSFFYSNLFLLLSKHLARTTIVPTIDLKNKLNLKGEIIGNVADISPKKANARELKESLGLDTSHPLIIWVGRIVPVKRIDRAINALSILKREGVEANLAIVGTGDLSETTQKLVNALDLNDRIKFLGFRTDAGELIGRAELLLLTSESEGLPTVMAEAMTQGVGLVMSDLAGIKEIAEKFPSYPINLVSPQTPEKFAEAIKESLNERRKVSENLQLEILNWFDPKRAAEEAKNLFQKLVSQLEGRL